MTDEGATYYSIHERVVGSLVGLVTLVLGLSTGGTWFKALVIAWGLWLLGRVAWIRVETSSAGIRIVNPVFTRRFEWREIETFRLEAYKLLPSVGVVHLK
jgi:hypothetical protein